MGEAGRRSAGGQRCKSCALGRVGLFPAAPGSDEAVLLSETCQALQLVVLSPGPQSDQPPFPKVTGLGTWGRRVGGPPCYSAFSFLREHRTFWPKRWRGNVRSFSLNLPMPTNNLHVPFSPKARVGGFQPKCHLERRLGGLMVTGSAWHSRDQLHQPLL